MTPRDEFTVEDEANDNQLVVSYTERGETVIEINEHWVAGKGRSAKIVLTEEVMYELFVELGQGPFESP